MPRVLGQEALHEFKAEWGGGLDQLGIIIARKSAAAPGQDIGSLIESISADGASASGTTKHQAGEQNF